MARADFIVNAIRQHLSPGSLWHEKRFALAQLESLVVASVGGIYSLNTFDASVALRDTMTVFGDLGIEVNHVSFTREALTQADIGRIAIAANSDFEALLSQDGNAVTSVYRRVTCNIEFASPVNETEEYAESLFDDVADVLDLPITFVPYVFGDLFLSSVDPLWPDVRQDRDAARGAAEFIFEKPLPVGEVTERFESLVNASSALSKGITTGISDSPGIHELECVGRYF